MAVTTIRRADTWVGDLSGDAKAATVTATTITADTFSASDFTIGASAVTGNKSINFPSIANNAISGGILVISIGGVDYYIPAASAVAAT